MVATANYMDVAADCQVPVPSRWNSQRRIRCSGSVDGEFESSLWRVAMATF
jgi:hypothetical protein